MTSEVIKYDIGVRLSQYISGKRITILVLLEGVIMSAFRCVCHGEFSSQYTNTLILFRITQGMVPCHLVTVHQNIVIVNVETAYDEFYFQNINVQHIPHSDNKTLAKVAGYDCTGLHNNILYFIAAMPSGTSGIGMNGARLRQILTTGVFVCSGSHHSIYIRSL
jgi:hypothetical protein